MTRYVGFNDLAELTKMVKTENGYAKFIQTGKLSLFDYNTGFIDLHIKSFLNHKGIPTVHINFGTVDDGDFCGWRDCSNMLEANELVEAVANSVFKTMVSFPHEDDLNKMLAPFGLYVCYQ